ncbi:MAG: hypothetical protein JST16_12290 [Bdellovibrionales bacterium]|nr:hypothetical protein [Bdellovibrionales bacterium]
MSLSSCASTILFFLLLITRGARATTPQQLETKISAQIARNSTAQRIYQRRIVERGGSIAREEWEKILAVPAPLTLTPSDLTALRQSQSRRILLAKQRAEAESALSLDKVRAQNSVASFCADLPKGGMLHIHPWGTLDRPTVRKVLEAVNPPLSYQKLSATLYPSDKSPLMYPGEIDFLKDVPEGRHYADLTADQKSSVQNLFFLPSGAHSFDRFEGTFSFMVSLVFTNEAVNPEAIMMNAFVERAARHHVRYVEVSESINPSDPEELPNWTQYIQEAQHRGVTVRLLAAFNRSQSPARIKQQTQDFLALPPTDFLLGINFLADETDAPAFERGQYLYGAAMKANRLHRSMHAGELGDIRNVRDALLMGVERIGHGVKLHDDPLTLEWAARNRVPIEVNLTSNERLRAIDHIEHHPYLDYLRLGLQVSMATDDEGIFETDISRECEQALNRTDVTYAELRHMIENSVATSFAPATVKAGLQTAVADDLKSFESRWKNRVGVGAHQ